MRMRAGIVNISMFIVIFVSTVLGIEYFCKLKNEKNGVMFHFLYAPEKQKTASGKYKNIDALLGYAYHDTLVDPPSGAFPMAYQDGFVVYGKKRADIDWRTLERPVIVALGGSTTEPNRRGDYNSWPEEMAKLMKEKNIQGTVVNGGVGGYSSSQELLKFIRDVIEIAPDILITYHGVNEDEFGPVPYPMNVPYLHSVLSNVVHGKRTSVFFPNTVYFIKSFYSDKKDGIRDISKGIPTHKSQAEYLIRNVKLMDAISEQQGIKHISILQPYIMTGDFADFLKKNKPEFYARFAVSDEEIASGKDKPLDEDISKASVGRYMMYRELDRMYRDGEVPMVDFRAVFDAYPDKSQEIYYDSCHVRRPANRFLAERILGLVLKQK